MRRRVSASHAMLVTVLLLTVIAVLPGNLRGQIKVAASAAIGAPH